MKYHINKIDTEKCASISETFALDMITSTILLRRGISEKKDLKFFLENDLVYQHSPFLFDDMQNFVDRITEAIEREENVLIFGDRDADGITSTALLYTELKRAGVRNLSYRLPLSDEQYGLTDAVVEEIEQKEITLVITVDNGISAASEIRSLKKKGIDTIVLDHHLASSDFPPACALIDPKIEGEEYPFPSLSGCAVAFKAAFALRYSRTGFYQERCILFHAEPQNDSIRMSAVKMENLIEYDECTEEISTDGYISAEMSRIISFLDDNLPILVLDSSYEKNMLEKAFGTQLEINLIDIRSRIEKIIPAVKDKSLFEISKISHAPRYEEGDEEILSLKSLFKSFSLHSDKSLYEDIDYPLILASIGTVADLMPLKDENRIIVKRGLKELKKTKNKAFLYMLGKLNLLSKDLTARDISFSIAPLLNSSGRMGRPDVAVRFLLSSSDDEIEKLYSELEAMNKERQRLTESLAISARSQALSSKEFFSGRFVLIESEIPRGLTGNISSKIMNEMKIPTMVLSSEMDDRISASMRSPESFDSKAFLDNFQSFFSDYGGHRCAAGFSMSKESLPAFKEALSDFVLTNAEYFLQEEESIPVDFDIPEVLMDTSLWKISSFFAPFGMENENIKLHLSKASVVESYHIANRNDWMRLSVEINSKVWPAVCWNAGEGKIKSGDEIEIIFSPEVNVYKGIKRFEINIIRMEKIIDNESENEQ